MAGMTQNDHVLRLVFSTSASTQTAHGAPPIKMRRDVLKEILLVMCLVCSEQTAAQQEVLKVGFLPSSFFERYPGSFPQAGVMRGNPVLHSAALTLSLSSALAAPSGFPSTGNGLWYTTPGLIWSRNWLPVGNGYLAGKCHSYKIGTQN